MKGVNRLANSKNSNSDTQEKTCAICEREIDGGYRCNFGLICGKCHWSLFLTPGIFLATEEFDLKSDIAKIVTDLLKTHGPLQEPKTITVTIEGQNYIATITPALAPLTPLTAFNELTL